MKRINTSDNGERLYFTKPGYNRKRKIIQIDPATNKVVAIFKSLTEAAESIGVGLSNIYDCANGYQKTSGGYRWEYLKEAK